MPDRQYIIANWKAHGGLALVEPYSEALQAAQRAGVRLVVCPPLPLLMPFRQAVQNTAIQLGAQNCRASDEGGSSGNPAATLLREVGCDYVLIGHADRRMIDTDTYIHEKLTEAGRAGLTPIFCVSDGEELLSRQLLLLAQTELKRCIVAYEPMWAIGSGRTPELPEIAAQLSLIAAKGAALLPQTDLHVVYGGSVSPENAGGILALPGCGGVLVGKASYSADSFVAVAKAAA